MAQTIREYINDAISEIEESQKYEINSDSEIYIESALEFLKDALSKLDNIKSNINKVKAFIEELSKQTY